MTLIERATILHYHRHRTAVYGEDSVLRLGWKGEESQTKRFQTIAAALDFNGRVVLDAGCGSGDLKRFLDTKFASFSYLGVDLEPAFIRQAKAAYEDSPRTWFIEADFSADPLPLVDIVVACGALAYRGANPDFHLDVVRKLYAVAREALIFNMLDAALFPDHPLLVGHNPGDVIAACREIAPAAKLIQCYLEDDFTVVMPRA